MKDMLPLILAYTSLGGSSLGMWALSHWLQGFAAWPDWVKRVLHAGLAIALAVPFVAAGVDMPGEVHAAIWAAVIGFGAALVGGLIYRTGRTQPGHHTEG